MTLLVMPRHQHWRLAMYDRYIATLQKRIRTTSHSIDYDQALLEGWTALRAEFLGELKQLAREEKQQEAIGA